MSHTNSTKTRTTTTEITGWDTVEIMQTSTVDIRAQEGYPVAYLRNGKFTLSGTAVVTVGTEDDSILEKTELVFWFGAQLAVELDPSTTPEMATSLLFSTVSETLHTQSLFLALLVPTDPRESLDIGTSVAEVKIWPMVG